MQLRHVSYAASQLCFLATAACTADAVEAVPPEVSASAESALTPWCSGAQAFAPGEISVPGRSEHKLTFSADGKTVWYSISASAFPFETIVESHRVGGHWTPAVTASFSGAVDDTDPALSPDGRTMYFSSDRPVTPGEPVRDDWEVWAVDRVGRGWGEPHHLGPEINDPAFNELYATVTRDGTIYFASDRPGGEGGWDLYRSERTRRGQQPAQNLGPEVNSAYWDYNPFITPDGTFLVYTSLSRPEGHGLGDLYGTIRAGRRFLPSRDLGPEVNTAADEYTPVLSADLRRLYFSRQTRGPGDTSDAQVVETTCLSLR
jgi:Tol biopolymer transport system component